MTDMIVFMAYQKKKLWRTPDEHGEFAPLSEKQIERLKTRALNYCVWALGQAPKTEFELRKKMREKNCPEDIEEETIQKLHKYEYLNDRQVAQLYISAKINARWGNRRIQQELRRKGISEDLIEELFAQDEEINEEQDEEYERAYIFASRKVASMPDSLDDAKKSNRLVGALVRRGFPMDIAFKLSNELIKKNPDI